MAEKVTIKALVFAVGDMPLLVDKQKGKDLLFAESKRYSGGFKGASLHRGINVDKESLYPQFISDVGVSMSSEKWTEKVEQYWAQFTVFIPFGLINQYGKVEGGRELNASYTVQPNGQIVVDNLKDYLAFEMMKNDSHVCLSPELYDVKNMYDFFCIDATVEAAKAKETIDIKSNATIQLAKLLVADPEGKDNTAYLRSLAAVLDEDVSSIHAKTMSREEATSSLFKAIEKNPKTLLEALEDKDLSKKSFIRQAVEANVLLRSGNMYTYNGERIGTEDEMLAFINDPDNSSDVKRMKAMVNEFSILGVE